jgi:hypothetical protein
VARTFDVSVVPLPGGQRSRCLSYPSVPPIAG